MTENGWPSQSFRIVTADYRNAPTLVYLIFLFWAWAWYIQIGVRGGGFLGAIRIEFLVGGILIFFTTSILTAIPINLTRTRNVIVGISLLFLTMILQIPLAALPSLAKNIFWDRVVKFAFMAFFIAVLARSPRTLKWFIIVWMVSMFWITAESVRGLYSGALVWQNQGIPRLHGAVPIYQQPNSLGGVSVGPIPFIVFMWPYWKRWWQRAMMLALLATSLQCILYTGSREAYVATIGFAAFWFLRSRRKRRWLIVATLAIPIAYFVMPQDYKDRFSSIGAKTEDSSVKARKQILSDAWAIFLEHPTGIGLGCFPVVRNLEFGRFQDTHNLYLEVATNLGIQGFLVFIFFVSAVMTGAFRAHSAFRRQIDDMLRLPRSSLPKTLRRYAHNHFRDLEFLVGVADAIAGFIFVRLVLGLFGMDLYEIYWWFGAGIVISLLEMVDTTSRRTRAFIIGFRSSAT